MKQIILSLSILICAIGGCKLIDKLTQFDIEYNYIFTLSAYGGVNLDNLNIETQDLENNTESTFEINDTRKDLIERATLIKMEVTIIEPADADFTFLNDIDIFISTANLAEKLIAWKYNIPADVGNYLKLETTNSDLKKYLKSDAIRVRLKTTSSKPLMEDLLLDLKSTVEVDAKILGI
ncbi:MAG: hypothetical protein V3R52_00430 [Candidatus Neomarinimicrobiota bacterium]